MKKHSHQIQTILTNVGIRKCSTLLAIFAFSLFVSAEVFAQIGVLQYRHVPQENIEEFLHLETTYWSAVAQKAIDEGKMEYWAIWQKVGGWNLDEGTNFLFVNVFKDTGALDNLAGVWDPRQVFPEMRPEDLDTGRLSTVHHQVFIESVLNAGDMQPKFMRINYYDVSDGARFLERETAWHEFITEHIKNEKTDVTSWRLARVMMPMGESIPFNAMTMDGYQKLSSALSPYFDPETEFPAILQETGESRSVDRISTYALVKAASRDE